MKTLVLVLSLVFALVFTSCGSKCKKEVPGTDSLEISRTQLMIINGSDSAVTVWITLGATEGCLQNVGEIPYITDSLAPLVGSFVLAAGDSTKAYTPKGMGFNGNLSFNTQPLNCPNPEMPNGVNIFEFIINNGFQAGNPQETVDISCVAGVNCLIKAYLTGGIWNAGSVPTVDSIYNKGISENSGLVGVYPYGCDTCTGAKTPPSCTTNSNDKQVTPICNVQRNATGICGGLVTVIYLGTK